MALEVLGGHLAIDQLLDGPDAGDAGTSGRPRREAVVRQHLRDLVQPRAVLDERVSQICHRASLVR